MLNLCLWIGNICNGLLLGNASIARGLTCCKNSQDMRLQENHSLQNFPLGEVNHIWPLAYTNQPKYYVLSVFSKCILALEDSLH